jgi:hypothetical protein
MKEDILLVKPEIPKNCEYLQNDLIWFNIIKPIIKHYHS